MAYDFSDDELRMLGVAAPVIMQMLRARQLKIMDKIYGEFKNGKLDHTANLAEFCSVRDQINEIKHALKMGEKEK